MTHDTFTREDLANDTPADESANTAPETGDTPEEIQAQDTRAEPATASRPSADHEVEEQDDEFPDLGSDEPMPDISDSDVAFDIDKLRAKTKQWVTRQAKQAVAQRQVQVRLHEKIARFAKDHPDFEEVVSKNPVLAANQLATDAGLAVAASRHTGEMLYRFGKDPALAIRVARMTPREQLQFVTRMEDQITSEAKARKTASTAQRQTPRAKGPSTREEQLSGKGDMAGFAAESRAKRFGGRFYRVQ